MRGGIFLKNYSFSILPISLIFVYSLSTKDKIIEDDPKCLFNSTADFHLILNAVEAALLYLVKNVESLVEGDADVGARILQAQFKSIFENHHTKLPLWIREKLETLSASAGALADRVILNIQKSGKLSAEDKKYMLPWTTTKGLWDLPINGKWEPHSKMTSYEDTYATGMNLSDNFDGSLSDGCLYQAFNCGTISNEGRETFFGEPQSCYLLSHQAIYALFARKTKCYKVKNFVEELQSFQEQLCGKIWNEANAIADLGFPLEFGDLFTEQVEICGLAGYPNFFRKDWMLQILQWQSLRKSGCFPDVPDIPETLNLVRNELESLNLNSSQPAQYKYKYKWRAIGGNYVGAVEEKGDEHCSNHFTAVGMASLAIHLRYTLDTCNLNF